MNAYRLTQQTLLPISTSAANPDELTRELPRGLYTTFSTNHGGTRVLGLSAHLERLYQPVLEVTPSASRADLRSAVAQIALSHAPHESRFRLILSASDGMVYIIRQPFAPPAKEIYENGVKVVTTELLRHDPRLKDSGFISESQSQRTLVHGDVYEVLLTKKGKIYEGMTSNFYAVTQVGNLRYLVTAQQGILLGVTRQAVLKLARGEGMGILYRAPHTDENLLEAFLTSSSRGVVPIVRIDDRRVGEGEVGAWTKRLSLAYQAYVEERSEKL
jgi:branched-chain amino acid aminotransferase